MLRVALTGGLGSGKSTVGAMFRALGAHGIDADAIGREMMQPGHPVYARIVAQFGPQVVLPDGQLDRAALARQAFECGRVEELNAIVHPAVIAAQADWARDIAAGEPDAVAIVESALVFETKHGGETKPGGETNPGSGGTKHGDGETKPGSGETKPGSEAKHSRDADAQRSGGPAEGGSAASGPAMGRPAEGSSAASGSAIGSPAESGSAASRPAEGGLTEPRAGTNLQKRFDRIILVTAPDEVKIRRFVERMSGGKPLSDDERASLEKDAKRRLAAQLPDSDKVGLCDFVIENAGTLDATEAAVREVYRQLRIEAREVLL